MRKAGGYAALTFADGIRESIVNFDGMRCEAVTGSMVERDTYSCFHCNSVVHVPVKADVNFVGFCRNCMQAICQRCAALPCEPFQKKLEAEEARYHARRSYGIEG